MCEKLCETFAGVSDTFEGIRTATIRRTEISRGIDKTLKMVIESFDEKVVLLELHICCAFIECLHKLSLR